MKKLFVILLSSLLIVAGCSNNKENQSTQQNNSSESEQTEVSNDEQSSENNSIEVDENLLTVDITLPASFVSSFYETPEALVAAAEEDNTGNTSYKANEDGSVTMTMSKAEYKASMELYAQGIEESFQEIIADESNTISNIAHDDAFNEVTLTVSQISFNEQMNAYGALIQVVMYHYFLGETSDPIVIFTDESGTELSRQAFSEFGK